MTDLVQAVATLRRPQLMIRAARAGLGDYDRARDLKRLMRVPAAPPPARALSMLLDEEGRIEATRQKGCATYSFARHIDLLIAMMAEARLLPRPAGGAV